MACFMLWVKLLASRTNFGLVSRSYWNIVIVCSWRFWIFSFAPLEDKSPLFLQFWTSGDIYLGFKARMVLLNCLFCHLCPKMINIWYNPWQPPSSQSTLTHLLFEVLEGLKHVFLFYCLVIRIQSYYWGLSCARTELPCFLDSLCMISLCQGVKGFQINDKN